MLRGSHLKLSIGMVRLLALRASALSIAPDVMANVIGNTMALHVVVGSEGGMLTRDLRVMSFTYAVPARPAKAFSHLAAWLAGRNSH